jgi:hypothetical protein
VNVLMPPGPRLAAALRRLPFTFALAGTILITTAVSGTLTRAMTPDQLEMWGFGGGALTALRWLRIPASTLQILEPDMAISMLATVLALVGSCEYRLGTRRTVVVFACSQLAGLLAVVAIARTLAAAGNGWGLLVAAQQEVGASPGSIGALGAWLVFFPRRLRATLIVLCALFLAAAFGGDVHRWDVAHAVAFPCGLLLGAIMYPRAVPEAEGVRVDRRLAMTWITLIVGLSLVLAPFVLTDMLPLAGVRRVAGGAGADAARWMFLTGGVALWAVASALRRGERRAWSMALACGAIATIGLWQPGAPGIEHVLAVMLVAGLVWWRREFRERASPRVTGLRAAGAIVAGACAFAVFGFVALRWQFAPPFGWAGSVDAAWSRLRFGPVRSPNWDSASAHWFLQALPVVAYVAIAWAVLVLVGSGFSRPLRRRESSAGRSVESV